MTTIRVCPYCFNSLELYLEELPKVKCPEGCGAVRNDYKINLQGEQLSKQSSHSKKLN